VRAKKQSSAEVRRDVLELLSTVGLKAAADAAMAVCRDATAPAPARATAAGLIFRATAVGGFGKNHVPDDELDPSEMTAEQLQTRLNELRQQRLDAARWAEDDAESDENDPPDSPFD
jgi:hypothetical protein